MMLDADLTALVQKAKAGNPLDPYVVEKVAEEAQMHRDAQPKGDQPAGGLFEG